MSDRQEEIFLTRKELSDAHRKPWMDDKEFILLDSVKALKRFVDRSIEKEICALDLETTGLNNKVYEGVCCDKIVGFAMSNDGERGYYAPVNHYEGNLPEEEVYEEIKRLCKNCKLIFHNARFDTEFLWAILGIDIKDNFEDTQILGYLHESGQEVGLKKLALKYFNIEMIELKDLFPSPKRGKAKIACEQLHPEEIVTYAASDAIITYMLYEKLKDDKYILDQKFIYKLEKRIVPVLRKLERRLVRIDTDYLERLKGKVEGQIEEIRQRIFKMAGHEFKLSSPKELGKVLFEEMGLTGGKRTAKKKDWTTSAGALESLKDKYPIVNLIIRYRELVKVLSSYIENLINNVDHNKEAKFQFHPNRVPTGRFASPGGLAKDGFTQVNVQSIPKDDPIYVNCKEVLSREGEVKKGEFSLSSHVKEALEKKDEGVETELDDCQSFLVKIVGKEYCFRDSCENCSIKGGCQNRDVKVDISLKCNIRKAFIARPGYKMVKIDYSGEELRLAANLSGELNWIREFNEGSGDLHALTAKVCFNKKEISERERQLAKGANFAILYGAGGWGVARALGLSDDIGERMVKNFYRKNSVLSRWIKKQHRFVEANGFVKTAFSRIRWIKGAKSDDFKLRGAACRRAVNTVIQGTAADIMKIAMVNVGAKLEKMGLEDDCRMLLTIHDELVFEVKEEKLDKIIPLLIETMTSVGRKWPVKLTVDVSYGNNWSTDLKYKSISQRVKKVEVRVEEKEKAKKREEFRSKIKEEKAKLNKEGFRYVVADPLLRLKVKKLKELFVECRGDVKLKLVDERDISLLDPESKVLVNPERFKVLANYFGI